VADGSTVVGSVAVAVDVGSLALGEEAASGVAVSVADGDAVDGSVMSANAAP
jgi:hypothetical protein